MTKTETRPKGFRQKKTAPEAAGKKPGIDMKVLRRVLNGDETDWQGPYLGTEPGMLRISVYAREPRK